MCVLTYQPLVNRLAVAATLLLEGPWTFFILAPHLSLRKFAAISQVLLQIGIILTGNYNFFNLLTIVMALAVLDVELEATEPTKSKERESQARVSWITRAEVAWQWLQTSNRVAVGMWLATAVYCVYSALEVFSLSFDSLQVSQSQSSFLERLLLNTRIQFLPTVDETQAWIARVLPVAVNYAAVTIVIASVWQLLLRFVTHQQTKPQSKLRFLIGVMYLMTCSAVSLWVFSSSVLTLAILDRSYQSSLSPVVFSAYSAGEKLHITSPYGLFRMMTGVGTLSRDGQHFTVVARPEIILEGTVDNGETWRAYHFKYKPGDVHDRPRLAMPLQPRLDWQMWFAALGGYQSAPWIVHLVHKLLEGSQDVKSLLDTSRDPFPDPRAPPQAIRAQLFYYDFTRLNSSWNRVAPNADVVVSDDENDQTRWWTRTFSREYLPPLEKGNPSLLSFVEHHYGHTDRSYRDESEGSCSTKKASGGWRLKSELCAVLRVLVSSEMAPFGLAATVLVAKYASSWVINAARSRFQTVSAPFKLKDE